MEKIACWSARSTPLGLALVRVPHIQRLSWQFYLAVFSNKVPAKEWWIRRPFPDLCDALVVAEASSREFLEIALL